MTDLKTFVKQQQEKGFNLAAIKTYLLRLGYKESDIDAAMPGDTGIETYIRQQHAIGYSDEAILNFLLSRGYPRSQVESAIQAIEKPSHRIRKSIIIASLILLGLVFIGGITYVMAPGKQESEPPLAISTSTQVTNTFTARATTTLARATTTTQLPFVPGTPDEPVKLPETFTPETAPIGVVLEQVKELAVYSPAAGASYCSKVEREIYRDSCYEELAKESVDKQYCQYVINDKKKDSCLISFALKKDYSVCDQLSNQNLKRSCESLKLSDQQYQGQTPAVAQIPQIAMEMDEIRTISLNDYVDPKEVIWTVSGNREIAIDINPQGVAAIKPKIGWSGTEAVTFRACIESRCDSASAAIEVRKTSGFVLDGLPDISMEKNGNYALDLQPYAQGATWSYDIHPNLTMNDAANILYFNAINDWVGEFLFSITGCKGGDCDSDSIIIEVQEIGFIFREISDIIINKNQVYDQLILSQYVDAPDVVFSNLQTTHINTTVRPDTKAIFTPEPEWIGDEDITFIACKGPVCLNQSMNVRVI